MTDITDQPLKASQVQDPDDPVRSYALSQEKALADDIRAAMEAFAASLAAIPLAALYGGHDRAGIIVAVKIDQLMTGLQPAMDRLSDAMQTVATATGDSVVPDFEYDPRRISARQQTEAFQAQVLNQFRDTATRTVGRVIDQSIERGLTGEQFAETLRDTVALAPAQAQAVMNYRNMLENGDTGALRRQMRDNRFDRAVRQAMGGNPLDQAQMDRMTAAYAARYRAARAATIAGDTAMSAATRGARDAYRQAVQRGVISNSAVRRFWLTAGDERVCKICRSIPLLNEGGVGLDQPYRSLNGTIDAPQAHSNCRCTEHFVVEPRFGSNSRGIAA